MKFSRPLAVFAVLMTLLPFGSLPAMAAPAGTPTNTQTYTLTNPATSQQQTFSVVSASDYGYGNLPGAQPCPTTQTSDTWVISGLAAGEALQGQLIASYIVGAGQTPIVFSVVPVNQVSTGAPISITVNYPPSSQWATNEIHVDVQLQVWTDASESILVGPIGQSSGLDIFGTCVPPKTSSCPATPGFWKNWSTNPPGNQKNLWPVNQLLLGSHTYSEVDLVGSKTNPNGGLFHVYDPSNSGDASMILAYQLFAAKLNAITGSTFVTPTIAAAITEGDQLLSQAAGGNPALTLPFNVAPSSALGQQMVSVASVLDAYNNSAPAGCTALRS